MTTSRIASMYGWRARIGYIVPSSGTVTEAEWNSVAPPGVAFVGSRVLLEEVSATGIQGALAELQRAARELASARVDVIVQVGTPLGFLHGLEGAQALESDLANAAHTPTVSMASACVDALRALSLHKIVLATPYIEELNSSLREFLGQAGFEPLAVRGLGLRQNLEINALPSGTAYRAAREIFSEAPHADGIFISSGGWRTFDVLEALEQDLGVPVVSSNAAALWKGLALAGVRAPLPGLGSLLAGAYRMQRETGESASARYRGPLVTGASASSIKTAHTGLANGEDL